MPDELTNTQGNVPLRSGFGWKRVRNPCVATEEERHILKALMHDLPDLKNFCRYFENKRRSLFDMAQIKPGEITFLNTEKVKELMSLPLSEDDKNGLFAYFDACTKIMVIKIGMERLPEGQYREIAHDRYYGRLSYNEIMEKYGVSHDTVRRAVNRTNDYLAEYVKWYKDLTEQMKKAISIKSAPFCRKKDTT